MDLKADDIQCETDLVVLDSDHQGRTHVLVGECKTRKEISLEDIENLEQVRGIISRTERKLILDNMRNRPPG